VQARQLRLGYVGEPLPGALRAQAESPSSFEALSLRQAVRLSWRRLADGRPRLWHLRRNHEMLLGVVLRDVLRLPIRLVFTSAAIRRHSALPRWLIGQMDAVIATTPEAARFVSAASVVGHGVDTERFVPPASKAQAWAASGLPGQFGLGVFGRIREEKGVHLLVAALCRVLAQYPAWTAVIGGLCQARDQAYQADLQAQLARAGLTERVVWLGEVPAADMPLWYQRLSITVACPLYEGYGLTLIEGMACGCAAVASRTGAFASMVQPGVSGTLVPVGDVDALTQALHPLMADPLRTQAMGCRARERAVAQFSIEREAEGIAAVYRQLWARRG